MPILSSPTATPVHRICWKRLRELIDLKLRYPTHFMCVFQRSSGWFPYLPGATYRRHQRKGTTDSLKLRGQAQVQGFPEYDYTFVDYDVPQIGGVRAAIDRDFFHWRDGVHSISAKTSQHLDGCANDERGRGTGKTLTGAKAENPG